MNKEEIIKYIFDEENYSNFIDSQNGGEQYYILLEKEESKILKDYISNLQDRIDKAIKYINSAEHLTLEYGPFRKLSKREEEYFNREQDLLDILKGSDNNE